METPHSSNFDDISHQILYPVFEPIYLFVSANGESIAKERADDACKRTRCRFRTSVRVRTRSCFNSFNRVGLKQSSCIQCDQTIRWGGYRAVTHGAFRRNNAFCIKREADAAHVVQLERVNLHPYPRMPPYRTHTSLPSLKRTLLSITQKY